MTGLTDYELPAEQLDRIFNDEIIPFLFDEYALEETPHLYLIGGQPGAGKSAAMETIQRHAVERGRSRPIAIVGDDLRIFHPAYGHLLEHMPILMPEATAQASGHWVRACIAYAREHRISTAVEGTFRTPEVPLNEADCFYAAGYFTCLHALAVPSAVSRLATVDRFFREIAEGRTSRWTPVTAHDLGYDGTRTTVGLAQGRISVSSLTVMNRSGDILFSKSRDYGLGSLRDEQPLAGALEALDEERNRPWDAEYSIQWSKMLLCNLYWSMMSDVSAQAAVPVLKELLRDAAEPKAWLSRQGKLRTMAMVSSVLTPPSRHIKHVVRILGRNSKDFPMNAFRRIPPNVLGHRSGGLSTNLTLVQWRSDCRGAIELGCRRLDEVLESER